MKASQRPPRADITAAATPADRPANLGFAPVEDARPTWSPTTRRRFLGLLAAGAAAASVETARRGADAPARRRTRWIGHC